MLPQLAAPALRTSDNQRHSTRLFCITVIAACCLVSSARVFSATAPAAAVTLSELGRLHIDAVLAGLPRSSGQERLRRLLRAADLHRTTPAEAQGWLQRARAHSQAMGETPLAENAYADAIECDLGYRAAPGAIERQACNRLRAHLDQVSLPYVRAVLWRALAFARFREGALTEALDFIRLSLDAALQDGGKLIIAHVRTQQGSTLLEYGLPERALASFSAARAELVDEDHIEFSVALNTMIGASQLQAGQPASALKIFVDALQWAEEHHANQRAVRLRDLIAQSHLALGQPDEAIRHLEGVFAGPVPELPTAFKISALNTLAQAYAAVSQYQRSDVTFERAQRLAQEFGDHSRRRSVTLAHADALTTRGQGTVAISRLETLSLELRELEPTLPLVQVLDVLARAYAQQGNYEDAYLAQTESREIARHIQGEDFARLLSYQRAELELDRQANELSLLRAREQSVKTANQLSSSILISLIMLGIIGGLLLYLVMSRRLQRQASLVQQQAAEQLETLVIARTAELENELASRLTLEAERRQLEASLAEGDKLRTIGQLTSGVAHDFNNLMTVVTLSAELLQQGGDALTRRQEQYVEDILLASESGSQVTSGLLAYARQQSLEPEALDLQRYIQQSRPLFQRTLGEGIRLEFESAAITLMVDKANLTTALINLMANAAEAMNGRGTVQLRVDESLPPASSPTCSDSAQEWMKISVTDSGRGMTQTERARAIEPFFTTKAGGKGSGLGLSMVYGFAKQSGGELTIDAPTGGGSCVSIWLPRNTSTNAQITVGEPVSSDIIPAGARVLLVEDQDALRETMCHLLESMGLSVENADSADAAMTMLQNHSPPDLLLSDVIMPGVLSGNELADKMRTRFPHLPVLLMSGYTDLVDIDYPILQKPFSLDELRAKVAAALDAA